MNGLCSVRKLGSNVLVLERYLFLVFVHCKLVSLAICLVILGSFFFIQRFIVRPFPNVTMQLHRTPFVERKNLCKVIGRVK